MNKDLTRVVFGYTLDGSCGGASPFVLLAGAYSLNLFLQPYKAGGIELIDPWLPPSRKLELIK